MTNVRKNGSRKTNRRYLYLCYMLGILPKGMTCKPAGRAGVANQKI